VFAHDLFINEISFVNPSQRMHYSYVINHFEKSPIANNGVYLHLFTEQIRLELFEKPIDSVQEKLMSKETKCKKMQDDLLKKKI
jgi:hypothetical protein